MLEIGLGALLVAAACVILAGAGGTFGFDLIPLMGYGGIAFVAALGILLVAAGAMRRAIRASPEKCHALRTARLTLGALLATVVLALGLPLSAEAFNLIRVEGFPVGYYLAAQGTLIGLVILAFVWASRQNRIDAEEQSARELGHE